MVLSIAKPDLAADRNRCKSISTTTSARQRFPRMRGVAIVV